MSWDADTIAKFAPRPTKPARAVVWDGYVGALVDHGAELFAEFGVDTGLELQHFMAQIAHESGGFTIVQESMNYRAERIMEIFGEGNHSAGITGPEALALSGQQEALAERVYGLGNPRKALELGNTEPGDGFVFRGTGLIQITGRADHERYFAGDYSQRQMLKAALMEFHDKGCLDLAAADNCKAITRKINGGYNGLEDRKVWLAKAKKIWPVIPFESAAKREETKPLYTSTQAQTAAASNVAGSYVAIDMTREALTAAVVGGAVDWIALAGKTVLNGAWVAAVVVTVMTARSLYLRWSQPDISGVVT